MRRASSGLCRSTDQDGQPIDHPGTERLFEPGLSNPVAKGTGPFYFPDSKARFNVARHEPPTDDVDSDFPAILTTGRVVSMFLSGNQPRRIQTAPHRAEERSCSVE
jgi:assimilatory nitrate reductase catalytic subunit